MSRIDLRPAVGRAGLSSPAAWSTAAGRTQSTRQPQGRPLSGGRRSGTWRAAGRAAISIPALAAALALVTVLASGPLHGFDLALNQPWSDRILPQWRPFVDDIIDPIASQAVVVPILAVTAIVLAWRRSAWRPLLVALTAEVAVVGLVGILKVTLARPSPVLGDPSFFQGGVFGHDGYGIIFPSGHAAQAVALYGILVYLLGQYGSVSRTVLRLMSVWVVIAAAVTMTSSIYLGWHWATDLIAGVLTGALVLRSTIWVDKALPAQLPRATSVPAAYSFRRPLRLSDRTPVGVSEPLPDEPADTREPARQAS